MRFVPLLLILIISCSPLKKFPLKSDRWENDIKFLESKDREEACIEDCILFVGSSSIRLWKEIESDMSPYKVVKRGYGGACLLYTSPSPRDRYGSRMPSSA